MFLLNRHKSERSAADRIEFKLSNFQAFQVPKGWDKLFLSIVSVETGKMTAKSSKAAVHGGTCQWTETFSESIWIYQDDASKEIEECPYKIVVATGSARSGILGEIILDLTDYMGSRESGPLSLPLDKCNHGTILQIKIQCHTPRVKSRGPNRSKETTYNHEELQTNPEDMENKSDGFDNILNKSVDKSLSASESHRSSDSGGSPKGRSNFSPLNSLNSEAYVGRQDSAASCTSSGAGRSDDISRSNRSSSKSRASGSSIHVNRWQEIVSQASAHGTDPLSVSHLGSSKDLLEVAEETIEELQGEAKKWERHSRKLKLDIETLKRENSEKFRYQTELEVELSAACSERDSLKQEVAQLKSSLEELRTRKTATGTAKIFELSQVQNELEDEVKFQKEANANLSLQLKKTQEANFEFVSILQELEETVERQTLEIASLTQKCDVDEKEGGLRGHAMFDIESELEGKLSAKEEEISKLEEKLSSLLSDEHRNEQVYEGGNNDRVTEIEDLKAKVLELERDCAELTDENLELIFKMKESEKDTGEGKGSHSYISGGNVSPDNSSFDTELLKFKIIQLEEELSNKEMLNEDLIMPLKSQIKRFEEKCAELEIELQHYKQQVSNLDTELHKSQEKVEEKIRDFNELQEKLETLQLEKVETCSTSEISSMLSDINKKLHIALTHVRNQNFDAASDVNTSNLVKLIGKDSVVEEQAQAMLKNFVDLITLLRETILEGINLTEGQELFCSIFKECKHQMLLEEMKFRNEVTDDEMTRRKSEMEEMKASLFLKEKDNDFLRDSNRELENLISNMQLERNELEEKLAISVEETNLTSKGIDEVQHDLEVLTRTMESQLSTNKMLEKKSSELENSKHILELRISELQEEISQLSVHASGMEVKIQYLTTEKESNQNDLEDSRSLVMDLKNFITNQQIEQDSVNAKLKKELQETKMRLLEEQEESDNLKMSHSKLQATNESLTEQCSSLQILAGELRRQKMELHEHSTHLEIILNESQKKTDDICKKVEILEMKLSSLQNNIASKEKSLISQLESILQEHKGNKEKLSQASIMFNQMESAKRVEIDTLQGKIELLTLQLSSTHDEREKLASDAVVEAFNLRSEKINLESSLQEALEKVKFFETEIQTLRMEYENKVQGLVDLLNSSKQSEETLMADIDRLQSLVESVKISEETFKAMADELESKLKVSDYEKQQIKEEILNLNIQLQKMEHLQDEILTLEGSLDEAKFEKGILEESLQKVAEECEELATEQVFLMEKISDMQKALRDREDERRSKMEKVLNLEGDQTATEASHSHEEELKKELDRIKIENSEYLRKIQFLEQEKDGFLRKARDLVPGKEENKDGIISQEVADNIQDNIEKPQVSKEEDLETKVRLLENELAQALETNNIYKLQLSSSHADKQNGDKVVTETVDEDGTKVDNADKIATLETELKEMEERYLHMSLQYAEVQADREELVMQLKSTKQGKKWFS